MIGRSSKRPASGEPIKRAITSGISIKLAVELLIASAVTANAGINTNPASPSPAPAERRLASTAWRRLNRLMRRIGSAARSSTARKTGTRSRARTRNGHTLVETRLAPKCAVST